MVEGAAQLGETREQQEGVEADEIAEKEEGGDIEIDEMGES